MKLESSKPVENVFMFQAEARRYAPRVVPNGIEEVEIVTGGRGRFINGDETIEVGPGDMLWYSSGELVEAEGDSSDPYRVCVIRFSVSRRPAEKAPFFSRWKVPDDAVEFCQSIQDLWNSAAGIGGEMADCAYHRIYWEAMRWRRAAAALGNPIMRKAESFIREHFCGDITVEDIARAAGASAPHLHFIYRKETGSSPMRQVLKLRLDKAQNLLLTSDMHVKEISSQCGFNDVNNFCILFRKRLGVSPGRFRKMQYS